MDRSVADFIAKEARFGARNYEPLGVVLSRGEGVFVWDTQGHRYLDCLSAYSAVNQGHCHPKILAAMVEQPADADVARLSQRPARPLLRRDRGADRLPQGAADEQRRRSGGECDQVGAQMGL
jgi:acetylornithine/succinyldiaminopimelate/putrescine aminotransferase